MDSSENTEERLGAALADRYTIEREIGSGGMATVYLAQDLKHDRKVAVKVLRPELSASIGAERFLREIQISAKLNHPHILTLIDSGEAHGLLYYVMPYVEGESLRGKMEREGQLPLDEAFNIVREVADGLGYAHRLDIVHRDIKPENVLLSEGHAVVADFGIAKAVSEAGGRVTKTGGSVGSPLYMSPEQAAGRGNLDGRSDLYSLACMLYEMLAGEPPFTGQSLQALIARHAIEPPPDVRVLRNSVPEAIGDAIRTALAKSPADRFRTVADFADVLLTVSTGSSDEAGRRETQRRSVWLLPAIGSAALSVGALALFIGTWSGPETEGLEGFIWSPGIQVTHRQLTYSGAVTDLALSPDGSAVAFGEGLISDSLFLQPTEGGRRVVLTEHGRSPQWAPDGSRIFFYRHAEDTDARGLYSVLPTGGEARWCGPGGEPFSVSPDGTRIAWAEPSFWELPDSTPVVVAASLDNPSLLDTLLSVKPYSRIDFFQWLGGGGQAYVSEQLDSGGFLRRIHGLDGGAPAVVLDDVPYLLSTNLAPEDEGVLFLSQEDRVTWTPLPSGPARELTQFSGVSAQQISLSADGLRLAYSRTQVFTHLNVAPVQADGTVGDPRVVSPRTGEVWYAALSPDGGAVAYVLGPAGGSQDLFVVSTSGGEPTRVTFLEKSLSYPVWSGDGSTLGFAMQDTSDTLRYVTVPATGGPTKTLASYPLGDYPPPAISDSGDTLFFPAEAGGSWTMVMASEGWQQELYPVSSWWTSTVFPSRGVSVAYIEEGWSVRALGDGTVQDSVKFDRSVLPGSGWATTPTLWTEDGWLYFSVLFQTERRNSETWYQEVWRVRESGGVAEPALRGADGTPMRFPDPAFLMISSPAADQVAWISSERYSDVWIAEVIDSIGGRR